MQRSSHFDQSQVLFHHLTALKSFTGIKLAIKTLVRESYLTRFLFLKSSGQQIFFL